MVCRCLHRRPPAYPHTHPRRGPELETSIDPPSVVAVEVEVGAAPEALVSRIGAARVLARVDAGVGGRAGAVVAGEQFGRRLRVARGVLLEQDAAGGAEGVALAAAPEVLDADQRRARAVQVGVDVGEVRAALGLEAVLPHFGFNHRHWYKHGCVRDGSNVVGACGDNDNVGACFGVSIEPPDQDDLPPAA